MGQNGAILAKNLRNHIQNRLLWIQTGKTGINRGKLGKNAGIEETEAILGHFWLCCPPPPPPAPVTFKPAQIPFFPPGAAPALPSAHFNPIPWGFLGKKKFLFPPFFNAAFPRYSSAGSAGRARPRCHGDGAEQRGGARPSPPPPIAPRVSSTNRRRRHFEATRPISAVAL